ERRCVPPAGPAPVRNLSLRGVVEVLLWFHPRAEPRPARADGTGLYHLGQRAWGPPAVRKKPGGDDRSRPTCVGLRLPGGWFNLEPSPASPATQGRGPQPARPAIEGAARARRRAPARASTPGIGLGSGARGHSAGARGLTPGHAAAYHESNDRSIERGGHEPVH